jgi:ureidoacrylate peracid hydrolase
VELKNQQINPALVVVDMQNGFLSKGGSYDLMGLNVSKYTQVVPCLKRLLVFCRKFQNTNFLFSSS